MSCRVYSRFRYSSTSSDSYSDCGLPCSISLARMRNFESSSSTFRSSKSQAIRSLSLTRVYTEFPAVALITICGCAWSAAAALRTPRFVLQVPVPLFCPPIPVPAETTRRQHSYNLGSVSMMAPALLLCVLQNLDTESGSPRLPPFSVTRFRTWFSIS